MLGLIDRFCFNLTNHTSK